MWEKNKTFTLTPFSFIFKSLILNLKLCLPYVSFKVLFSMKKVIQLIYY